MTIQKAAFGDLAEILRLQRLAWQSEARLLNNCDIPPLKQTAGELEQEFETGIFLKAVNDDGGIIGSVRGFFKDGTLHIGKLMVHPDAQGQGIGGRLLSEMERACPALRYELFTSSKSERNIRLYERHGYVRFKTVEVSASLVFVYLEKAGAIYTAH